ncbi:hypothetical protein [Tenacibaculum ovolyticum]|uniref:hypothetical protein n=1 Tax=Tenacibaculum ovolyticum TaxID=104270 RepID=UPI000418C01E|nr:hypothetical protein [Tenacibaculum ovolyticum]
MATISEVFIRHTDKDLIISFLSIYYTIGKKDVYSEIQLQRYYEEESKTRTFVIHKERNNNWTQVDYELGESTEDLKEFDEWIIEFTREYNTQAIIAYEQTTSGSCRFAFFDRGKIIRSIIQAYLYPDNNKIRMTENLGEKFDFETYEYATKIREEIDHEELLSYHDDFKLWLSELECGWGNKVNKYENYIHLEILK